VLIAGLELSLELAVELAGRSFNEGTFKVAENASGMESGGTKIKKSTCWRREFEVELMQRRREVLGPPFPAIVG
jgi:hypothetical protein